MHKENKKFKLKRRRKNYDNNPYNERLLNVPTWPVVSSRIVIVHVLSYNP